MQPISHCEISYIAIRSPSQPISFLDHNLYCQLVLDIVAVQKKLVFHFLPQYKHPYVLKLKLLVICFLYILLLKI